MDDSCVVCAETMEWVAYGACGHVEVCAVCIARLRFVCDDRRCCICKSLSPVVFVTRALGSLTRVINDFSILPADAKDGKVGSYWFHEGIQAYFDDFDAYKIIKAMCKLSCSVCDKSEAEGKQASKKRGKIKNIELLKDHLSRQHELFFCSLCLGNKKVFICEQKLYSGVQLRRHISCGDSEVDGCETERCGFSGHPLCEFCQAPFYGDHELYFHMSTEHYTCHICMRQHPTRYQYYKDYDDLENHFGLAHFLCEDNTCLEKKFIVFASEADMKRHAALEHGGNMSRSKRNAALQLPTCFRSLEREETHHRVRAHAFVPGLSSHEVSSATSASAGGTSFNFLQDASSTVRRVPGHSGTSEIGSTASLMLSSGQRQGTSLDFRGVLLSGSDFPPLPRTSKRRRRKSKKNSQETGTSTADLDQTPSSVGRSSQSKGSSNAGLSTPAVSSQSRPLTVGHSTSSRSVNSPNLLTPTPDGICSTSSAKMLSSSIKHGGPCSSAHDPVERGSLGPPACSKSTVKEDDIQAANKSLIDSIRATLEFDKDKFVAFKIISKEYREGQIDAGEYLAYIHQFGLAHLILDLARLCPDPQKQKALIEIYKTSSGGSNKNGLREESVKETASKNPKKGKEKCEDSESSSKAEALPDSIVNHMEALKLNAKRYNEEPSSSQIVDHSAKGKSKTPAVAETSEILSSVSQSIDISSNGSSNRSLKATTIRDKKKLKKSSKFLKTRLGDSSVSMVTDLSCSDLPSDLMVVRPNQDSILASVRGVWRNGGGRRLVTMSEAMPSTR